LNCLDVTGKGMDGIRKNQVGGGKKCLLFCLNRLNVQPLQPKTTAKQWTISAKTFGLRRSVIKSKRGFKRYDSNPMFRLPVASYPHKAGRGAWRRQGIGDYRQQQRRNLRHRWRGSLVESRSQ
jgi:hypothetical protein